MPAPYTDGEWRVTLAAWDVIVNIQTRRGFLNLAASFEGATLFVGLLLGWWTQTLTLAMVRLNWQDLLWGVAAVVPMLSVLALAGDLRRLVRELLGPSLAVCRWYDLAALALLAGLGEELLFRGTLEAWIGRWNPWAAVIIANLLFGLAHAVTPTYLLVAGLMGAYFSWLHTGWSLAAPWGHEPNLLRPIIAHAVYDFIAFQLIARDHLRESPDRESSAAGD